VITPISERVTNEITDIAIVIYDENSTKHLMVPSRRVEPVIKQIDSESD
jgi:hypothetical protein